MKIIRNIEEMRLWSRVVRRDCNLAFVPTMGALHEGHLSLLREGRRLGDALAASIYINPAQFGPREDLSKYPRTLDDDLEHCERIGVDAAFVPTDEVIYPNGYQTFVSVEEVTKPLCGASRPGHFRGVTTVVAKLFNIVEPDIAIFGEKDFQQLVTIRRMVDDLSLPIDVVGCPIVREPDGLAMSSRNRYLSSNERRAATSLYRSLNAAQEMIDAGETDAERILLRVGDAIASEPLMRIDYAEFVDAETLEKLPTVRKPALLALAAYCGNTRLIDNRCFR